MHGSPALAGGASSSLEEWTLIWRELLWHQGSSPALFLLFWGCYGHTWVASS